MTIWGEKPWKKFEKNVRKIWKLIKKSYLCTPIWKTGQCNNWEFFKRLERSEQKNKNFSKKVWKFKNNAYLCIPVRKTGPRKRIDRSLFLRFFAKGERGRRELPDGNDRQTKEAWQRKTQKETRDKKFIEKTDYCTRSKYRENTIYREALISLEIMKCQRQA